MDLTARVLCLLEHDISEHYMRFLVTVLMLVLWVALAAGAIADEDLLAMGILAACGAAPFLAILCIRSVQGTEPFASGLVVLILIVLGGVFRFRDLADKSIDLQSGIKIMFVFVMGLVSVPTIRRLLEERSALLWSWLAFYSYMTMTGLMAGDKFFGVAAGASVAIGYIFALHMLITFGESAAVRKFILAGLILSLASIIVYFSVPSFGRVSEWVGRDYTLTSRLQGVFGAANSAGGITAYCLLVSILLLRKGTSTLSWIFMLALLVFCVLASQNRMALLALASALGVWSVLQSNGPMKLLIAALSFVIAALAIYTYQDSVFSTISRTGSAEEILSGTGRTKIWPVAFQLWSEHPLIGLGYTSSTQLLRKYVVFEASHTHNLVLEVLFSGGLVGLALLLWCVALTLSVFYAQRFYAGVALVTFFIVYGLTEPILFGRLDLPVFGFLFTTALATMRSSRGFALQPEGREQT